MKHPEDVLGPLDLEVLAHHRAELDAIRQERLVAAAGRPVELDCEVAGRAVPCMGCVLDGPEHCYEQNLPTEVHAACAADAREQARARAGEPCHDCAFRPGSPESAEEDLLLKHIRQSTPFRCHQGMPLDARGRLPTIGDFAPLDPAEYPVCGGWAAARASWLRRRKARDAVRQLARGRVPTTRARWYAALGLRSWRPRRRQRKPPRRQHRRPRRFFRPALQHGLAEPYIILSQRMKRSGEFGEIERTLGSQISTLERTALLYRMNAEYRAPEVIHRRIRELLAGTLFARE